MNYLELLSVTFGFRLYNMIMHLKYVTNNNHFSFKDVINKGLKASLK